MCNYFFKIIRIRDIGKFWERHMELGSNSNTYFWDFFVTCSFICAGDQQSLIVALFLIFMRSGEYEINYIEIKRLWF